MHPEDATTSAGGAGGNAGGNPEDGNLLQAGDDDTCTESCSMISPAALASACQALWNTSCDSRFSPMEIMAAGTPLHTILANMKKDASDVAKKVHQMNPSIGEANVKKCEACHVLDMETHMHPEDATTSAGGAGGNAGGNPEDGNLLQAGDDDTCTESCSMISPAALASACQAL